MNKHCLVYARLVLVALQIILIFKEKNWGKIFHPFDR